MLLLSLDVLFFVFLCYVNIVIITACVVVVVVVFSFVCLFVVVLVRAQNKFGTVAGGVDRSKC